MTRLYYSAGVARIVVIQQNWLTRRKYTDGQSVENAGTANPAVRG